MIESAPDSPTLRLGPDRWITVKKKRNCDEANLVWSSEPSSGPPAEIGGPTCARTLPAVPGVVLVGLESTGRRGKTVTVIRGLLLPAGALDDLARDLKKRCGTGGTVRGEVVEVQGDQRETVVAELEQRGWTVKRAGG
jgi:translation initiation factor 1